MGTYYPSNWIVALGGGVIWTSAQSIEKKGYLPGNKQGARWLAKYPSLPGGVLWKESRIIIVGHGNPESTHISGDKINWDARKCAETVRGWLLSAEGSYVRKVRRISFSMCHGAKGEGGSVYRSFAHKFASYCDFADEVVARTGVVNIQERGYGSNGVITKLTDVSRLVDKKHKQIMRKVKYIPVGGTLTKPKDPYTSICWSGELDMEVDGKTFSVL